jgi:hypothetical protein
MMGDGNATACDYNTTLNELLGATPVQLYMYVAGCFVVDVDADDDDDSTIEEQIPHKTFRVCVY